MVIRRQTWELLGQVITTFGEIVGRMNKAAVYEIKKDDEVCGKLIVHIEKIQASKLVAQFDLEGKKLKKVRGWFNKNNPFFKLFRLHEGEEDMLIYESEVLQKEAKPHWKPFETYLFALCENIRTNPAKIIVYSKRKNGGEKFIGESKFTIDELEQNPNKEIFLSKPGKNSKNNRGIIKVNNFSIKEKPGFLDYLRGGLQLNVILAIDFTSSNKEPSNHDSLHAIRKNGGLNLYQKAICGFCGILLHYNYDKKVTLYGFGGKPRGSLNTSHAFTLTENEEAPWAYGVNGVMEVYKKAVHEVTQSGPTYFEHIMKKAMKIAKAAKENASKEYIILTILTDGLIHDEDQTITCLVEAAKLPMSVVVIGVGDADFKKMEVFNREESLYNAAGMKVERKLIQFAPFNKFSNEEELSQKVLKPIPNEVVEYMRIMNINPDDKTEVDISKLSPQKGYHSYFNQESKQKDQKKINQEIIGTSNTLDKETYCSVVDQDNRI